MGDPGAFLRSFVPAALVDACGAAPEGLSAVGRHFDAAILVADISGFTALADRFSARDGSGNATYGDDAISRVISLPTPADAKVSAVLQEPFDKVLCVCHDGWLSDDRMLHRRRPGRSAVRSRKIP